MKYMVVDDEPLARQRIKRLMGGIAGTECIAEESSAEQVLALIERYQPQLLLLDINMPGMNGLELAQSISLLAKPPKVVFVTAHSEYALDAFSVFASGYLVKPITLEQLQKVVTHLFPPRLKYLLGGQTRWVEVEHILVAKANEKYTTLFTGQEEIILETSLKGLLAQYPEHFVQVHRNTLVKRAAIFELHNTTQGYWVSVVGFPDEIAVSRRAWQQLQSLG